jgi:hypothetical protein
METAQHWDRLAKNQPAEITMFRISEVQESPAFNGRRSFLTLRDTAFSQSLTSFFDGGLQEVFVNHFGHDFLSTSLIDNHGMKKQARTISFSIPMPQ